MSSIFSKIFNYIRSKKFPNKQGVIVYIDGFNLYYGLKEKLWQKYYWLNIQNLSLNLLKQNQLLKKVKYFTARVSSHPGDPQKSKRQITFLEALETLTDTDIYYGKFLRKPIRCVRCGKTMNIPEEKMTDVNIATELIVDAYANNFDTAILISADSDLSSPMINIKRLFPNKKLIVAFPPNRYSVELDKLAYDTLYITRSHLSRSQFPPTVKKADGFTLVRPTSWQ
ncbi:MAG: NYN domain-containing protein [Candidatus Zixiibacteriota bacterium]|nr:MAG: NYN domain-containing protein [candidate division Zixibacteria bacterium]